MDGENENSEQARAQKRSIRKRQITTRLAK